MATETLFLRVPGTNAAIAWSHIIEAHYFPVPDEPDPDDEEPNTRMSNLLVLTMDVQTTQPEGETRLTLEPLTLRFHGDAAARMWEVINIQSYPA